MNTITYLVFWTIALSIVRGRLKESDKNYNGILKSLKYPEKLLFDIRKSLNAAYRSNSSEALHQGNVNNLGIRLSPILLYGLDGICFNGTGFSQSKANGYDACTNETVSVYFLFKSNCPKAEQCFDTKLPLTLNDIEDFFKNFGVNRLDQFTLIFNVREWDLRLQSNTEQLEKLISEFRSQWWSIKLGLEYSHYDGDSLARGGIRKILNLVNVSIANIYIPATEFILSYSKFKFEMRRLLDQMFGEKSVSGQNTTLYTKINFAVKRTQCSITCHKNKKPGSHDNFRNYEDVSIPDEFYHKYYYYVLQFSVYWVNDGERERIIVNTFSNELANQDGLDGTEFKKVIAIQIPLEFETNPGYYDTCQLKAKLDQISTQFKTISVDYHFLEQIPRRDMCRLTNSPKCDHNKTESQVCNWPIERFSMPDVNLRFEASSVSDYQFITSTNLSNQQIYKKLEVLYKSGLPLKNIEVNLHETLDSSTSGSKSSHFESLISEIPSDSGINIACNLDEGLTQSPKNMYHYSFSLSRNSAKYAQQGCRSIWNRSNTIVWNIRANIGNVNSLTTSLHVLGRNRRMFLRDMPDKSVTIRFLLYRNNYMLDSFDALDEDPYLYCNKNVLTYFQNVEIIVNFARIHNISVEIADVLFYYTNYYGWWRILQTIPELNITQTKFPVLVARNFPEKFLLGDFEIDPCLTWSNELPRNGIPINLEYSGATLYINKFSNGSISSDQFELMLLFSLHKFSLVEIVPETIAEMNTIIYVLSQIELVERLEIQQSKPVNLYIRMDSRNILVEKLFEKIQKLAVKPKGIHFINWEKSQHISEIFYMFKQSRVKLGISLEDCVNEVNNGFSSLKRILSENHIDYLLCNIKQTTKTTNFNIDEIAKYLDTTLYIKKYFLLMFPKDKMELYFRLNTVPSTISDSQIKHTTFFRLNLKGVVRDEVTNFLTFYSDVNQYASLNKIKLFMVPVFDDANNGRFGWWKILNYEDLSNSSVFVEKEAEYLQQPSWQPTAIVANGPLKSMTPIINFTLGLFLSLGVIFLLILSAILSGLWYRRQFIMLTRKEVLEFKYGNLSDDERNMFEALKFPNEYEIPRSKIVLRKGNFGLVYKATFAHGEEDHVTSVAVKIPRSNCTKDSFRSMLSELKILCYVGDHPNVLKFFGANTKVIGRGILYITTELCENGALQEYLRKLSRNQTGEGSAGIEMVLLVPNIYELCRFSQEIASGMDYIASKKIVHGDLSTRNILLDSDFHCKIADFGLSSKLYEYQACIKRSSEYLPWAWLAIESLKRKEFTVKSDVWAYGVTMWEIFSLGNAPYPGLTWTEDFVNALENGYRMSAPALCTTEIFEQMTKCWDMISENRPNFSDLVQFFSARRNREYVQVVSG